MDKHTVLKQTFGYSKFRPGQERLIDALLAGRDVLGVMPTGGGKSLCYQVPALLLPGLTLVISPLISLMKDQVAALCGAGAGAAFLNSSLTAEQQRTVCARARQGTYKLLYVAPERLATEDFLALTRTTPVSLLAVDEAHCISQWGQDFRPSYRKIAEFLHTLPVRPPVAAFTATATARVQQDIREQLELRDPLCEVTGFDRPNLYWDVRTPRDRQAALLALVRERQEKCGIIYCSTRAQVEKLCDRLQQAGFAATRYHAGLSEEERRQNQEDFQFDRKTVMVATNAFGMGIDKSNVSYVFHYNMPKSLEAYYQEAGRAGRDGEPADCILFYSAADVVTARALIGKNENEELDEAGREQLRRQEEERLRIMAGYCKTTGCLRGYILDYFGQEHPARCEHCGNCLGEFTVQDVTVPAQMALSCVLRIKQQLGYYVGKNLVVQTLRGSREQRLLDLGLDGLSTYGLMKDQPVGQVRELLDYLEQEGCLHTNPLHATLEPGPAARGVLFGGETVSLPVRKDRRPSADRPARAASGAPADSTLFEALRALRTRLAKEENVPAYVIFSNATLTDMAAKAPRTEAELLEVSGVGQVKADRYGRQFLDEIARHIQQNE